LSSPAKTVTQTALLLLALLSMSLSGCGKGQTIHGQVTVDGLVVPIGQLSVTPDVNGGNDGPQVQAVIRDSEYQFIKDSYSTQGKNFAIVMFSKKWLDSGGTDTSSLGSTESFLTLKKEFDVPADGTFNFEFESKPAQGN